ncbi:hypothetical protein Aros01_06135 [Streptosporangium roseum]
MLPPPLCQGPHRPVAHARADLADGLPPEVLPEAVVVREQRRHDHGRNLRAAGRHDGSLPAEEPAEVAVTSRPSGPDRSQEGDHLVGEEPVDVEDVGALRLLQPGDDLVDDRRALRFHGPQVARLGDALGREDQVVGRVLGPRERPQRVRLADEIVDDLAGEPLVDHPGHQQEDLAPRRIVPVAAEHLRDELVGTPLALVLEPPDDLVRAEELQEGPVHESVDASAVQAEDEVALPELVQHAARDGLRRPRVELVAAAQVADELLQEVLAPDVVAGQPRSAALHPPGHPAQQFLLVLGVDVAGRYARVLQMPVDVPVLDQHGRRVDVHRPPLTWKLLAAPDDREDGQQQGVARQLPDGRRVGHRAHQPVPQMPRLVLAVAHRQLVPALGELPDLSGVQILERVVPEPGVVQLGPPVSDDPAGDEDPHLRISRGESGDLPGHRLPHLGIEQLVQPVEDDQCPPVLAEVAVQGARGNAGPLGPVQVLQVLQEGLAPRPEIGVGAQLHEQGQPSPQPGQGLLRPVTHQAQDQIARQRRLAGAGIAEQRDQPVAGLAQDVQHRAPGSPVVRGARLRDPVEVEPLRKVLLRDLLGAQQPPPQFLGQLHGRRIRSDALRDEHRPEEDGQVGVLLRRGQHLQVEPPVALFHPREVGRPRHREGLLPGVGGLRPGGRRGLLPEAFDEGVQDPAAEVVGRGEPADHDVGREQAGPERLDR